MIWYFLFTLFFFFPWFPGVAYVVCDMLTHFGGISFWLGSASPSISIYWYWYSRSRSHRRRRRPPPIPSQYISFYTQSLSPRRSTSTASGLVNRSDASLLNKAKQAITRRHEVRSGSFLFFPPHSESRNFWEVKLAQNKRGFRGWNLWLWTFFLTSDFGLSDRHIIIRSLARSVSFTHIHTHARIHARTLALVRFRPRGVRIDRYSGCLHTHTTNTSRGVSGYRKNG